MTDGLPETHRNYDDVEYARGIAARVWQHMPLELFNTYQAELEGDRGGIEFMHDDFLDAASAIILEAIQKLTGNTHAGICPRCGLHTKELQRLRRVLKSRIEAATEGVARRRQTAEDGFRRGVIPDDLGLTAAKAEEKPDEVSLFDAILIYVERCADVEEAPKIRAMLDEDRKLFADGPGG